MGFLDYLLDTISGSLSEEDRTIRAARRGEAEAQYKLGEMYYYGNGVKQSNTEAAKWYEKAAEQGNADAQYSLGLMYEYGRGVQQDASEAVKWYRKAAEQGNAAAQHNLGVMYENGSGVKQDAAEAVRWYRKAAEQGYAAAQNNLGLMYKNGSGAKQDDAEAVRWYRKAAEQGDAMAQCNLGVMYDTGRGVKQSDTEAAKWYRKAAEQGIAVAQYSLGNMYKNGNGVKQNDTEAAKWYRKAAKQGNADAQNNLGEMYYYGNGVKQNDTEAAKWYRKAAEQGNADAQYSLGFMYNQGMGVKENDTEAAKWYRKAAEQGNADAQYSLGDMYEDGSGVKQSNTEAVKWYRKAAVQKQANAQYKLGFMYTENGALGEDYRQAAHYFQKAAEQELGEAQYVLGIMHRFGLGVKKDSSKAEELLEASLRQGVVDAAIQLAELLEERNGEKEKITWLNKMTETYGEVQNQEAAAEEEANAPQETQQEDSLKKEAEDNMGYWEEIFEQAEKNYNQRNWKAAYEGFEKILNAGEKGELNKLACYYLAQIEILEFWNADYKVSKKSLASHLRMGFEQGSILSLLQIICLRAYGKQKMEEELAAEVYQKRDEWKAELLLYVKEVSCDLAENEFQIIKDKEKLLFLETFLIYHAINKEILELDEATDNRGQFFLEILEYMEESLSEKEGAGENFLNLFETVDSYGVKLLGNATLIQMRDEDDLPSGFEKEMVKYAKEKKDWIYQMLLAEAYYYGDCFDEDEEMSLLFLRMAGDAGIPEVMERYYGGIDSETEAKKQAQKWVKKGYSYAMKIYSEVCE